MAEQNEILNKSFNRRKKIYLIIAILIGVLLIAPKDITWARDRINYLVYAESSWTIMQRYISNGILSFFSNEPLFLGINIILSFVFLPENSLKIIIFTSTLGTLYSLGKISKYNFWVLFFFLFLPQIVQNNVTHLRQGLALSLYLLGLTSNKKYGEIIKYASVFVHISFGFIIIFEFLEAFFKKIKFSSELRIFLSSIFLTAFVFVVPNLALFFGDRRVMEYDFTVTKDASGLGFLLWLIVGMFFIFVIKKNYISSISCYGIMLYLVAYFFLDFGARIFENIIPLILVSALNDDRKEIRITYILFFLFYGAIQWYSTGVNFLI